MGSAVTDRTAKRFVLAVSDYITGVYNPVARITIEQAASMGGVKPEIMRQHLHKIKAPIWGRGPRKQLALCKNA